MRPAFVGLVSKIFEYMLLNKLKLITTTYQRHLLALGILGVVISISLNKYVYYLHAVRFSAYVFIN